MKYHFGTWMLIVFIAGGIVLVIVSALCCEWWLSAYNFFIACGNTFLLVRFGDIKNKFQTKNNDYGRFN